ncbi:MAG TPA: hypothetical protein VF017_24255 [Thermoanaerobaculia bacterium]|nr:hypothetical protein [Thermoanaerobaculia bacterium]
MRIDGNRQEVKRHGVWPTIMTTLGLLSSVTGLTVNLPKALPVWMGWLGASLGIGPPSLLRLMLVLLGTILMVYGIRRIRQVRMGLRPIRLVDLLDKDGVLRDLEARDCVLLGPAIVLHSNPLPQADFFDCTFDGYDIPPIWSWRGELPIGAIRMERCSFYRCRFMSVAWAMPDEVAEEVVKLVLDLNESIVQGKGMGERSPASRPSGRRARRATPPPAEPGSKAPE